MTQAKSDPRYRELTITRIFDAPRALVFEVWTDPRHVSQWWGPRTFSTPVCEIDARVGGALRIVMHSPHYGDAPMRGIFTEVVPPERLVFTNLAVDERDNVIIDGLTTVTFEDLGGKTKLTLHTTARAMTDAAMRNLAGMDQGWSESIDKLSEYLGRAASHPTMEQAMHVTPYLTFNGTCEAAFAYYAEVLGGKIEMMVRHEGTPAAAHTPANWLKKILHARINIGDQMFMGSDAPPDHYEPLKGISVTISVEKPAEADRIFNALGKGGTVRMPIQKTFFAERFGTLTDQFGVPWMINCPPAP